MRIGTWNLKLCPTATSERGQAIAAWMDAQDVDIWLLTEVRGDWDPRGGRLVVAPPRGIDKKEKRWAGIETATPLRELRTVGSAEHAGEEGLVLARLALGASSVLVACSVLPWRGAGEYWPGLPSGQAAQFRYVLDHHVARIAAERLPGEPLIWGGDFNQPLTRPFWGATADGATALRAAFDGLGLIALTEQAQHLNPEAYAIDHLAVSPDLAVEPVAEVHRPGWDGGQLSDHAAYTAELRTPAPSSPASEVSTPGTWRRSDGRRVDFSDAKAAWSEAAREVLIEAARRYGAYVTYGELAERLFDETGIETRMQLGNWIGKVLGVVAQDCHRRGEPHLTALCVRTTEEVGPGYAYVIELAGEPMPEDLDVHAAEARLACYRHFGADLPADGGRPTLTRRVAAERERQARRQPRPVAVCSTCFLQLPSTGRCDSCG